MRIVLQGVTVTNWSKEPFLTLNRNEQAKLGSAIQAARQMAADALARLKDYRRKCFVAARDAQMAKDCFRPSADAEAALEKYFDLTTASVNFDTDFETIINKLEVTEAGLRDPFDIVVGHIFDTDDFEEGIEDAIKCIRRGKFKDAVDSLKGISKDTRGWVSSDPTRLRRLHLNMNMINSDPRGKIARTIVHEATHKFANTDDVAYKWQDLKYNAGAYTNLTNNADSYAWACRLIWKKVRNLPAGS
jgi:Lysine-specific metallo-endopeptidase